MPFEVICIFDNSPKEVPTINKPDPPASICIAILGIIEEEALKLLEYTEPIAHEKAPISKSIIPITSTDALVEFENTFGKKILRERLEEYKTNE